MGIQAFSAADKDQDGLISREDFAALMSKFGVKDPVQLATYFDAVNQDGTGMIKYSEFVAALLEESFYTSDKQLEAAFNRSVTCHL
jgi:Ca2+-binding EF-hand superfamily protein